MQQSKFPQPQIPLILRFHRLMDAFAKSDDERDFYLDNIEGFLIYADLDKDTTEIMQLEEELEKNKSRYALVPKMTFFEVKKFMEGFVHEKVYDIDTKEKLLDIIAAKEARENFLEFIYDNLTELEKWQQYYQERSRIKIIEWLRSLEIKFVFEEDLDLNPTIIEKLKRTLFEEKVSKDISQARNFLEAKAKTYYSNEALNPRPKRGRPPKQAAKIEVKPQYIIDIYTQVPKAVRHFVYNPEIASAASVTFSARFDTEEQLLANLKGSTRIKVDEKLEALSQRLESLQKLSQKFGFEEDISEQQSKIRKALFPFKRPKLKETKKVSSFKQKDFKIEEAVKEALPRHEEKKKRPFSIKKVARIKSKKKDEDKNK